ncbi:MAG: iron-sulfur cluster assembly scaffold protein [Dehalococcoidia bacterium]|nr:iron-sulfur cluster assembly scaffold protein [Dehalococcoidia bacterium]
MATEFDELQNEVIAQMKQVYTETAIDHAMNPRNAGSIAGADGFGSVTGPCGDTMEIWLKVKDGKVADAAFWTDGCGTTIACGSMVTEMVKSRNVVHALAINQSEILGSLGGLPEDSLHCALLAADTLQAAIRDYLALKREPWKKAYRR